MPDVRVEHGTYGPFRGGVYNLAWVRWVSGKKNRKVEVTVSPTRRTTKAVCGPMWKVPRP